MSVKAQGRETLFQHLQWLREEPIHTCAEWIAEIREVTSVLQANLPDTCVVLAEEQAPGVEFFIRFGFGPMRQEAKDILILRILPWGNTALLRLYWHRAACGEINTYGALCDEGAELIHEIEAVAFDNLFDAVERMCSTKMFRREILHHRYLALSLSSQESNTGRGSKHVPPLPSRLPQLAET